jgi:hypothetical protein
VAGAAVGAVAPAIVVAAAMVAVLAAVIGLEELAGARRRARGGLSPLDALSQPPELDRAARDQPA